MFGASKFAIDPGRRHPGFNDVGSVIGAVAGPVIGGLFGSSAADTQASAATQAAGTSAASADKAIALQKKIYEETVARQQPWLQTGQNALAQMAQGTAGPQAAYMKPFGMADYQADPGYSFRLKEGMKALEQGAAARGGLLSGNMLRGAQEYGQGLASQEYQNAYNRYQQQQGNQFNRLASLAGVGQSAVGALGQAGQNYAGNVGNIGMTSGANQANALLSAGQARASSLGGWGQALGGVDWGGVFGGGGGNSSGPSGVTTSLQGFYTNPYA